MNIRHKINYVGGSEQVLDSNSVDTSSLKFYVFQYLIPRPFTPIKRVSKVYSTEDFSAISGRAWGYSLWNFLCCWFCPPMGPVSMVGSNKANFKGIDVSDDIAQFVSDEDLQRGFYEVPAYHGDQTFFEDSLRKEMVKVFEQQGISRAQLFDTPVIYVKAQRQHFFYIGKQERLNFNTDQLINGLKNKFSRSEFEVIDLTSLNELSTLLINQGQVLGGTAAAGSHIEISDETQG
ncbi:hypothetical protein [Sanyastnella coralliicola]|uniref:hypothetical protein n=1 Tax=Sanyastnella coralliicola TaxID=3069118 RepID=UPI0027B8E879|nr:hypothetical protein [Longitalea sp. SCSIO 12813]